LPKTEESGGVHFEVKPTENKGSKFWSKHGKHIGYLSSSSIYK